MAAIAPFVFHIVERMGIQSINDQDEDNLSM